MSTQLSKFLAPLLAISVASGMAIAASTGPSDAATAAGVVPHVLNCPSRSWAVTTAYQNLWSQSPYTAVYSEKNGGSGVATESFSWSNGISGQTKWGQTQGAQLGLGALMASLDVTFGGSTAFSYTVDQSTRLTDSINIPSGAWAYFAIGYHAEFGSGKVETEMPTCHAVQTGSWFHFGFPIWPAVAGICSWKTGETEASCSNSTPATKDE